MNKTWLIAAGLGVAGAAYLISRRLNLGTASDMSSERTSAGSSTSDRSRSSDPFGRSGGSNYSDIE